MKRMGQDPAVLGRGRMVFCALFLLFIIPLAGRAGAAESLELQPLIEDALKTNPEVSASQAWADAARFRIPQVKSLPDPMFMIGYQNEGFSRYTYGDELMSAWMFSASQMFPFPGKLGLKGELASREADNLGDVHAAARLRVAARVKELYYDLFLAYKEIDLVRENMDLFVQIENAAAARYSSGNGSQQEVLMAQAEKYMLLEREEMARQNIQSVEAALNATVGRDVNSPLGRPVETAPQSFEGSVEGFLRLAYERSPEIKAREKVVAASEVKVLLAKKEYYPDFTVSAEYDRKGGPFLDMWALRTSFNIPLYYRTKQRQGEYEAAQMLYGTRHDLEAVRLTVATGIRENYAMVRTAERLMEIYKNGLVPKTHQDFESALAEYSTGRVEAVIVISRLKSLLDYETSYWKQWVEKAKAIARIEAITGALDLGGELR